MNGGRQIRIICLLSEKGIRNLIDRKQREDYNLIAIDRMHFYTVKHSSRAVSICLT